MSEWQPIETAPKDGSMVIVALLDALGGVAWVSNAVFVDRDARWSNKSFWLYQPTHWMPLPEPPNA